MNYILGNTHLLGMFYWLNQVFSDTAVDWRSEIY